MKKSKLMNDVMQGLLMAAAVAVGAPHVAMAQDLAASVNNMTSAELTNVPDIIDACFYIGGAAFTGSGLLKLKAYSENPANAPLGQGVGRLSVGAALLALPYIANAVITSFAFNAAAPTYQTFNTVG